MVSPFSERRLAMGLPGGRDHVGKPPFSCGSPQSKLSIIMALVFTHGRPHMHNLIGPKQRQCVPAGEPPPSCSENSPCSAPFSCTELSSHLQLLTLHPPSLETYLKCHLLPKTSPDDSKPHTSLSRLCLAVLPARALPLNMEPTESWAWRAGRALTKDPGHLL